jgi:hypothetical protein
MSLWQRQYGGINNNIAAGIRHICHYGNGNMAAQTTTWPPEFLTYVTMATAIWWQKQQHGRRNSSHMSLWQRQYGGINNNMAAGIRHICHYDNGNIAA